MCVIDFVWPAVLCNGELFLNHKLAAKNTAPRYICANAVDIKIMIIKKNNNNNKTREKG